MFGLDLLHNSGVTYIGDKDALNEKKKTIIVLGVARGGTSLVSGTLSHLGVFGGERSHPPVFEDLKLAEAFEQNNFSNISSIIEAYNLEHDIWSFKRPASIEYIDKLNNLVRNPIYLVIFKDIFAVSNRNSISMKSDILLGLNNAYRDYGKVIDFISKNNNLNAFFFSYEKTIQNKEVFVDTLISIIGEENITTTQKTKALEFIEPNPSAYLNVSRITRSTGNIGIIQQNKIIGWARHFYSPKPVVVELVINNKVIQEVTANEFRKHLIDSGEHPTGNCGFSFNLKEKPLKNGDIVSVKVKDDVLFVKGSNFKYQSK